MATVKSRQVQTAILIEPQVMRTIEEMAAAEMVSRADIIRRLIRRGLEMERLLRQPEPARKAS